MSTYRVFTRNWWKRNPAYPNGLEPNSTARKHTIGKVSTPEAAQDMCRVYNLNHKPGRLGRKAEYMQVS